MDCSLPGSSVHGIFQARVLEWAAISFSRGSSQPRDQTQVSRTAGRRFTIWAARESSTLHEFECHSCAGAMLIFSVSFQFLQTMPISMGLHSVCVCVCVYTFQIKGHILIWNFICLDTILITFLWFHRHKMISTSDWPEGSTEERGKPLDHSGMT